MLNLKVQSAFNELRGYPTHRVVITESARYIGFRQTGVNGRGKSLDVRPENVEFRGFVGGLATVIVPIPLDDLLGTGFPFLKIAVIGGDHVQPLIHAGCGLFHLFSPYDVHVLGVKHDEVACATASA